MVAIAKGEQMNWALKGLWIVGGVMVFCVIDLATMFWSRSRMGGQFGRASWNAGTFGKGRYSLLPRRNIF